MDHGPWYLDIQLFSARHECAKTSLYNFTYTYPIMCCTLVYFGKYVYVCVSATDIST